MQNLLTPRQGPAVVFLGPYLEGKFGIRPSLLDVTDKTKKAPKPVAEKPKQ